MRQSITGALGAPVERTARALLVSAAAERRSRAWMQQLAVAWVADAVDGFSGTSGSCHVAGAGRLDAVESLARQVGCAAGSDTGTVLAAAYRRWGGELPERLRGRFAIVAWDDSAGTALVAVDRMGAESMFVAESGGSLLFASELVELLPLLAARPSPDESSLVHWLARGTVPYGCTFFAGVERLADGERVRWDGRRLVRDRYLQPRFREPLRGTSEELAEALRGAVSAAVVRALPAHGRVAGILLSGGLDSGTVAVAAVDGAGDSALRGFSAAFPDHPTMDESRLVLALSGALGIRTEILSVRGGQMAPAAVEFIGRWLVPAVSPNLHFLRRLVDAARASGAAVLLDGQGGDELFGCEPHYLADLLRRGRVPRAVSLARRLPRSGEAPSPRELVRVLRRYAVADRRPTEAPRWLNDGAAAALGDVDEDQAWRSRLDGPLWWRSLVDAVVVQRQRMGVYDFLRRKTDGDTVDAHPLLEDAELVDLVLSLPPETAFDAAYDRPLLRRAFAGRLPDAIRLRQDKSYFDPLFRECLEGADGAALERYLGGGDARIAQFVRGDALRASILDAPRAARSSRWAWTAWRLLTAELWLRTLEDDTFPARSAAELGG